MSSLASRQKKKVKAALTLFYKLGFIVASLGMIVAFCLLLGTCWALVWRFLTGTNRDLMPDLKVHLKRDVTDFPMQSEHWPTVRPIIPGVTVPFSDLPILLCSVFISQVVHEVGHAMAAAIENVPIQSVGASLTLILPSASVAFAASTLDHIPSRSRSAIVSAGPFHNLVFWFILALLSKANLAIIFLQLFGYRDISSLGRLVVDVTSESPLSQYLRPGTLITHIDDTSLALIDSPESSWNALLRDSHAEESKGWCIDENTFSSSQSCCSRDLTTFSPLACFRAMEEHSLYGCLDPLPILTVLNGTVRCGPHSPCPSSYVCTRPAEREQLLRLTVGDPQGDQNIILWSGPLDEIEHTVMLGTLEPRLTFLPLTLPLLLTNFMRYLSLATLSLYFFNLLPLHLLDGSHLLAALLDMGIRDTIIPEDFDVEAIAASTGRAAAWSASWAPLLSIYIPNITLGVLVLSSILILAELQ
ncbi:hypothetical protein AX17_004335 [Amanita inopinata Kibby_2008]|nr:hypothetical protein AX17_004335 [Amanita inopinata Kibby_2008]